MPECRRTAALALNFVFLCSTIVAEPFRGIVPVHSNRADVEGFYQSRRCPSEVARMRVDVDADVLIRIVEGVCDVEREDFCGPAKGARQVSAKEALIVSGRPLGATITALSRIIDLSAASVSRRYEIARGQMDGDSRLPKAVKEIVRKYRNDA